jgi:ssDNA-binding replication factor A large subunit
MIGNYDKILDKLSQASGIERQEVERKIEAKRAKLSGLISKEGAAQIIAAELGISFDNEKLKINELLSGMRKANVVGKIIQIFPIRTFTRNGNENKVANFILADDTANIKVVLWDVNHIGLIESNQIGKDSIIEIFNGSVRGNEIHLGSFSELKQSNETFEEVKTEQTFKEKPIAELSISDNSQIRAFIVQIFEPRFFEVCPECKKKLVAEGNDFVCAEHGKIVPEKRALMNLVLDDGTETIRAVLFNDAIEGLGLTNLEDKESFDNQKENLLGKEMFFSGNVRNNNYFNNTEFIVGKVSEINLDELINQMEK